MAPGLKDWIAGTIQTRRGTSGVVAAAAELTSFLGRERELTEIEALLGANRIVTLTGVGGAGKTRLAQEVVRNLDGGLETGFVDLAGVTVPDVVPAVVARSLGVEEQGRDPRSTLCDALGEQEMLLVLDNCERLLPACADLATDLLGSAPALRVLATSRAALRIPGEQVWPVPPLDVPEPDSDPEIAASFSAVRLFCDRAQAVRPDFSLSRQDLTWVISICEQLEGIPLAIELAAAWSRMLSPQEIAQRAGELLRIPAGPQRGVAKRHRTLQATLDWSIDLLGDEDRRLLEDLSVFRGGFSMEAAEIVRPHGSGDPVVHMLLRLVDSSLLVGGHSGPTSRYRMLEPVREYAAERLSAAGRSEEASLAHARYFAAFAAEADRRLGGAAPEPWLRTLDDEHDNLRAALAWSLDHEPDLALDISGHLSWFWFLRGQLVEGARWLDLALAANPDPSPSRALALTGAALAHAVGRGDGERGVAAAEEAVTILRELGDRRSLARALCSLARVLNASGALDRGEEYASQALEIFEEVGSRSGPPLARLIRAGSMLTLRRDPRVPSEMEIVIPAYRDMGSRWGVAWALNMLGEYLVGEGRPDEAEGPLAESAETFREIGLKNAFGYAQRWRAAAALERGDVATAKALALESVEAAVRYGETAFRAGSVQGLAEVLAAEGDARRSAEVLAAAGTLRRTLMHVNRTEAERRDALHDRLLAALGPEELERRNEAGRRLTVAGVLAACAAASQPRETTIRSPATVATFRREGDTWLVGTGDGHMRLADAKGLHHIAELLARPNREIHVFDLVSALEGISASVSRSPEGMTPEADAGPLVDAKARKEYGHRLKEISEDLQEAESWGDSARAAKLAAERDEIAAHLSRALGLGGRQRRAGSPAERARVNVTRVIKDALRRIERNDADLGYYLQTTIQTGTFCVYRPPPSGRIDWQL